VLGFAVLGAGLLLGSLNSVPVLTSEKPMNEPVLTRLPARSGRCLPSVLRPVQK
jgi:hypothetical protein